MKNAGLITGASSGIGKELARIHAERKNDLIIVARREEELQELKKELESKQGVQVMVITKDLTAKNACKEIYDEITAAGIDIEYLFNNAGYGAKGKFWEIPLNKQSSMIDLNIQALVQLTHLFLPGMVERGRGRVLHTASTAGFMPGPLQATYFATKAFVNSFSKAVASELNGTGVTMTALCPGAVKTEFAAEAGFENENDHKLFAQGKSARYTAEKGYEAMMDGKLEVITEFALKFLIKAGLPITPESINLKVIKSMQS